MINSALLLAASLPSTLLNGLVGYWKLDGDGNDVLGVSNGTVQGSGSSWSTGKIGSAFYSGGAARVNVGGAAQIKPTAAISLGGWFWFNTTTPNARHCSDWHQDGAKDRWIFPYSVGSTQVFCHMGVNLLVGTFGVNLTANTWHHLVATCNVNAMTSYCDGALVSTATGSSLFHSGAGNVCIGQQEETGGGHDGRIDEFGMWNRAITAGEVTEWYNAGAGKTHPF